MTSISISSDAVLREEPRQKADKYIWAIYIALLAISVVELYSASSREVSSSNVFGPIIRHSIILLFGFGITYTLSRVNFKWLIPLTPLFMLLAVGVSVYVFFKGDIINGARRSTTILGIGLQSAELLKLAAVLCIAYAMAYNQERRGVNNLGVIISAGFVLFCGGLLFSQGLTNTILLMGISMAMMLVGGIQIKKWLTVLLVYGVIAGCGMMYKNSHEEQSLEEQALISQTGKDSSGKEATMSRKTTWTERISRWQGDSVPKYQQKITAKNRQEMYSYMAQANGSWHGVLPGNSRETARLPLAFSDYIFAIIVEDWGLIGGIALLALYLALLGRAGALAAKCRSALPTLLIMGMALLIVLQALFHMAIVTGVFPVSGQPLPLISKGGSSILVTSLAFGIMLSVSRSAAMSGDSERIDAEIAELPASLSAENPLMKPADDGR